MISLLFVAVVLAVAWYLAMRRAPLLVWAVCSAVAAFLWQSGLVTGQSHWVSGGFLSYLVWLPAIFFGVLSVPVIRRGLVIAPALSFVKRILPPVSETEQQALDAGTVGLDAELFSGRPDWSKLRSIPPIVLTKEEQDFLDGPTEELCEMMSDWQVRFEEKEIPPKVWEFAKSHGFLGMLISKEHGGLGFSPQAQSLILGKIASRSPDVASIVMVPNSLGPGELIEKYGTDQQQKHYLPRLAKGLEVPCFSLTGPTSGSDAATMRDIGYVTRGEHDGQEVLGIRLSWDKRYITLGPKATLIGLAFRLFDPDGILDKGEDIGITVALVPTSHKGVNIGRRHLPSGTAFPNGPNWGTDVFIPMEWVIGGESMVGQGWRMLMECLAAGRAISLPSSSTAAAKSMLRFSTAYGRVRKQFGLPVARMEGVEEALVRIVESAYLIEAARAVTASIVSRGEKPAVISALMKYQTTERMRACVNDAMDIHGGRGICDGPSNYLQAAYQIVPVGITVEGANILTRTLITFAQGALRAHPYLIDEIHAAKNEDSHAALNEFEEAFSSHISFLVSNVAGALFHNLTGGYFANAPTDVKGVAAWYKQAWRQSHNFALIADLVVVLLGGGLKTKQKLTGRMADALSELYFLLCILKRYEDDGFPKADAPIVELAATNALFRCQQAFVGVIDNFPHMIARWLMRFVVYPFGRHYHPASDALGGRVARLVLTPGEVRDRLTRHMYVSNDPDDSTGILEVAFKKVIEVEDIEKKLERAIREGKIKRYHGVDWFADAVEAGVLTQGEADQLKEADALVNRVIAVDHFDPDEVRPNYMKPGHNVRRDPRLVAG